ncbi:MAG: hypothetical protein R3C03_02040 [Pirellulaceae bacterium]
MTCISNRITFPTSTTPTAYEGSSHGNETFNIDNTGTGTFEYLITDSAGWMSVSPTSGTSIGEVDTITVSFTTSALAQGTYNATITVIDSNASNSLQTIAVTLTITDGKIGGPS